MVAVTKVAVDQLLFAPPFLALILSLCVPKCGMAWHLARQLIPLPSPPSTLQADDGGEWGGGGAGEAAGCRR